MAKLWLLRVGVIQRGRAVPSLVPPECEEWIWLGPIMQRTIRSEITRVARGVRRRLVKPFREMRDRVMFPIWMGRSTPVLVYQMGKVGSSSIGKSLAGTYPGISVNAHDFSPEHHRWLVRRLHRGVMDDGAPLEIVSLIREPIGRNVSAFFENFERDTGVKYRKSELSVPKLRELFLTNYRHDLPLDWFEKHIESRFGIDVYASPFPESGHETYENDRFRLLVLKVEIPDEEKESAIARFLDLDSFRLERANVGELKIYADTYKAFKREVRFPAEYVETMCESRYFKHFYSQSEIAEARRQWSDDQGDGGGRSS